MNEFEKKKRLIEDLKQIYPPGTRIVCIKMNDFQAIPSGTRGTVNQIDDEAQILINWDNGRSLALIPTKDGFRKLNEQEIEKRKPKKKKKDDNTKGGNQINRNFPLPKMNNVK